MSIVASTPFVITVGKDFPASTLAEFIAEVKKKPGAYTYASAGVASTTQAASVLFLKSAGLNMVHVPYRGLGPAFTDLVGGQVQMLSASPVELRPFMGTDKVKPLGISSKQRSRYMPDVPAIIETLPSPFVATYNGLMAPKGTPKEIINTLSAAIVAAEKTPEFLAKARQDRRRARRHHAAGNGRRDRCRHRALARRRRRPRPEGAVEEDRTADQRSVIRRLLLRRRNALRLPPTNGPCSYLVRAVSECNGRARPSRQNGLDPGQSGLCDNTLQQSRCPRL